MKANPRDAKLDALERWIAEAFGQTAPRREPNLEDAVLFDQAGEAPEPSADIDLAALGADRALEDVERFLDRTEAWLHGRPDAVELLERLRDRLMPQEPAAGEDEPMPAGADDEGDADRVEASAQQRPAQDMAAGESASSPAEGSM